MVPQQNDSQTCTPDISRHALWFVIRTWSCSVEVFLHKTPGARFQGLQAAAVLLLVPFYSMFWEGHDITPLLWFLGCFLGVCFINRINGLKLRKEGVVVHSYYSGEPYLMRLFPKYSERMVKTIVEPVVVVGIGVMTIPFSRPLGFYLFWGGVCQFVDYARIEWQSREQARDLNDAVIEQQLLAERLRSMRGESF